MSELPHNIIAKRLTANIRHACTSPAKHAERRKARRNTGIQIRRLLRRAYSRPTNDRGLARPPRLAFANVAIKKYAQIEGKELGCKEGETKFLLFLSNDDHFLLLSFLDLNDQELMRKYELLLNSVEKKP
jgi:hypothetical protein